MLKFLRVLSTILSALALVATPFLGIFISLEFALVGLGVAAIFFFAMLLFKSFQEKQEDDK